MIRLAGLSVRDAHSPDGDIEIAITGKRPGEKMYEELFYDESSASSTKHPKIMRSSGGGNFDNELDEALARLILALEARNEPESRSILFDMIQ
jgi:FlaA1/EpsC-like NDP-sugar epimerase